MGGESICCTAGDVPEIYIVLANEAEGRSDALESEIGYKPLQCIT